MLYFTTQIIFGSVPLSGPQVQDAQATMRLYTMVKKQWEAEIKASKKDKDYETNREKRKPKPPRNNKKKKLAG